MNRILSGDFVLSKRLFLKPWKKVYVKKEIVTPYELYIETTEDINEAIVFQNITGNEYMRIQDDYVFTRFSLEEINIKKPN